MIQREHGGAFLKSVPEQVESLKKTEGQVADPASDRKQYPTPDYAKNQHRSIKPEVLVLDRLSEGLVKRELLSASRVRSVFQRAYPFRTLLCVDEDAEAMEAGESFIDLRRMAAA